MHTDPCSLVAEPSIRRQCQGVHETAEITGDRDRIDEAYRKGYGEHPLDEPDAWGDLASFRRAAAR